MKAFRIANYFSLRRILGFLLCILAVPAIYAAQGGNGGGGGGGNGNDGPSNGDLYGDAVYLLRDPDTGVPELINGCIRPLWGVDGMVLAINADFESGEYVPEDSPENIEGWSNCEPQTLDSAKNADKQVIMADVDSDDELEACDVITRCLDYVTEADLGRLSILKSPDRVLDRQLGEAIDKLESGDVMLDASGRPVVNSETFDSPLLNLALYREFHRWGAIVKNPLSDTEELVYGPGSDPDDFILAAAFGLGAGDDKEGVGIDREIAVRTAAIIDLGGLIHELSETGEAVLPVSYEFTYEGKVSYFVNYSEFDYSRADTFPGNVCYDYFDEDQGKYVRASEPVIDAVFGDDLNLYPEASQLTGFALAANDARRVLVFAHDNLVTFIDSVFETTEITPDNCPPLN